MSESAKPGQPKHGQQKIVFGPQITPSRITRTPSSGQGAFVSQSSSSASVSQSLPLTFPSPNDASHYRGPISYNELHIRPTDINFGVQRGPELVSILERKVNLEGLSEKVSLYKLCRAWVNNDGAQIAQEIYDPNECESPHPKVFKTSDAIGSRKKTSLEKPLEEPSAKSIINTHAGLDQMIVLRNYITFCEETRKQWKVKYNLKRKRFASGQGQPTSSGQETGLSEDKKTAPEPKH